MVIIATKKEKRLLVLVEQVMEEKYGKQIQTLNEQISGLKAQLEVVNTNPTVKAKAEAYPQESNPIYKAYQEMIGGEVNATVKDDVLF